MKELLRLRTILTAFMTLSNHLNITILHRGSYFHFTEREVEDMRNKMTSLGSHLDELICLGDVSELLAKPLVHLSCTKSCLWTMWPLGVLRV